MLASARPAWRGTRWRVSSDTPAMTAKTAGAAIRVGWVRTAPAPPVPGPVDRPAAATGSPAPVRSPAAAPAAVSPRHQMARTSSGHSEHADTLSAIVTRAAACSAPMSGRTAGGTASAATTPHRNAAVQRRRTHRESVPARDTTIPQEVEMNAGRRGSPRSGRP
ncbi:hypothetical protein FHX41_3836 [Actinomadura hallensis]|uniref:Uncharacterized protein n=1 Tax=Actinomadura hallensis TaxID=337895 RepID=A0A543IHU3_9ACTN|nr:hypothetical protein [Actinomadura hallensis]TQM70117.1 hypothetical protein FHX41_3836 [Actinomadura hallensis]